MAIQGSVRFLGIHFFTYKYLVFFVLDNMNTVFDLQICSLDSMFYMYETMYIIILDKTCRIWAN